VNVPGFIRVLRERWLVLLIAMVLGLGGASVVAALIPTTYTAEATLYVTASGSGGTSSEANDGQQLSQQRVKSYVLLVSSPRVMSDVIRRLSLPDSPSSLGSRVTASSATESVLIRVDVVDESPDRAAEIADTVGDAFSELVARIEPPAVGLGRPEVAVQLVQPAVVPSLPSSLGLKVILALGLLVGIVAGVAAALLRDALDTRVKSVDQLRSITRSPNLGSIVKDPTSATRPFPVRDDPFSPRAEAFRQLRTNLRFLDVDRPRKVLVVTSPMVEEGKSTTVLNLAMAMASTEKRVLVIDGDLRRPTIAALLGLEGAVGLTTVLSGMIEPESAIQPWADGTIDVLTSGALPPNPSEMLGSLHMEALLASLRLRYDAILIDSSPLLPVTDTAAVAPVTDGVLLLCRYKRTTQVQIHAAIEVLSSAAAVVLGTALTMVPEPRLGVYGQYSAAESPDSRRASVRVPARTLFGGSPNSSTKRGPEPAPKVVDGQGSAQASHDDEVRVAPRYPAPEAVPVVASGPAPPPPDARPRPHPRSRPGPTPAEQATSAAQASK